MVITGVGHLRELAPERVTSLRYEDILADPATQLRCLADFIGVAADRGWMGDASALVRPRPPTWLDLPEPAQRRLTEACAPGMELLRGPEPVA